MSSHQEFGLSSNSNSPILFFIEFNLVSADCFSSRFSANSISCSESASASFSRFRRSSAAVINLCMLSSWEVFWVKILETSEESYFSDSIFLSKKTNPDEDLLSIDLDSLSCFSAFSLSFETSCFLCCNFRTNFSYEANELNQYRVD